MKRILLLILGLVVTGAGLTQAAGVESDLVKNLKTTEAKKPWELTLAAGTALNSGNSDTRLTTASALFEFKSKPHELFLGADLAYGTDQGDANVDNANGKVNYHYRFSDLAYAVADATGSRDGIAALQYRFIASPGIGIYLIKNDTMSLGFEGGPGYNRGHPRSRDSSCRS